jgi:tetratricopeptide (TPR) repeat protein
MNRERDMGRSREDDAGGRAGPDRPEAVTDLETDDRERESAYGLLQRGHALMLSRHHAQAAIVLERAARAEPGKGSILEALGRAFYNSGQHERSRQTFEALLEIDPSADYAHFALGQSLKQLDRRREARTHLRLAVALNPRSNLYRSALDRLGDAEA